MEFDDLSIEVVVQDGASVLVSMKFSTGVLEILGDLEWRDRHLVIHRAHIGGLGPGVLGRRGLNAIARCMMEYADVDILEIFGAARSTGRNPGRAPKPLRIIRKINPSAKR